MVSNIVIKYFYLTQRWDLNWYYKSGQSGPESNGTNEVLHIPQSSKTGQPS